MLVCDDTSVRVQRHGMPRPDNDKADALAGLLAAILDAFVEQDPMITPHEVRAGVESFATACRRVLDRQRG